MWSPACDVFKEESEENSMAKNLIPIIINELGVEIGEEFKLKYNRNGNDCILKNCEKEKIYRFTETELEEQDYYNNDIWHRNVFALDNIVYGIYEIVKLPFVPKYGEEYWTYMGNNGTDDWGFYQEIWNDSVFDYIYKSAGCVFRTKEEARAALPVKYKELTGKEWDKVK